MGGSGREMGKGKSEIVKTRQSNAINWTEMTKKNYYKRKTDGRDEEKTE